MTMPLKPVDLTVVDNRRVAGLPRPRHQPNLEHVPLLGDEETVSRP